MGPTPTPLTFDHVILAVQDLDAAARRLHEELGLASVIGGRHPGHGTGNRIVPLGADYIELLGIVDAREAAASPLGQFVADLVATGDQLMALCLGTRRLDELSVRLDRAAHPMSRTRPDGVEVSWRLLGLEDAIGPERLPFFIEWQGPAGHHPGRTSIRHEVAAGGIAWVELGGEADALEAWLGAHDLEIRVAGGDPGIRAVGISSGAGEIRL
jgi:hypothetical protein